MRILFLSPLSKLGGAEHCLLDLIASLLETQCDLSIDLIVSSDGPLVDEAKRLGVRVHVVLMPDAFANFGDSAFEPGSILERLVLVLRTAFAATGALLYAWRLSQLIRRLSPDVIHSNGIKCHVISVFANRGVPVVWHIRDQISLRPVVARALRRVSARASASIAVSKLVEQDARPLLGNLPIHVIHDEIDTTTYSPGSGNGRWLDDLAGFDAATGKTIRVGLVATYARWKGQDVFIEAIRRISESRCGCTVRFFIVGGPIYETRGSQFTRDELLSLAIDSGVAHRLGFVPFLSDVVEVYRSLDIVVHASTLPEPFGRTIGEALACGRAVVFSSESGAAELVPASFGNAIAPVDASRLARAIQDLVDDEPGREKLASDCRELALKVFSPARLGTRVLEVLDYSIHNRL